MEHNLVIFEEGEDRFDTRHVVVHIQPSSISIPTCKIYKDYLEGVHKKSAQAKILAKRGK